MRSPSYGLVFLKDLGCQVVAAVRPQGTVLLKGRSLDVDLTFKLTTFQLFIFSTVHELLSFLERRWCYSRKVETSARKSNPQVVTRPQHVTIYVEDHSSAPNYTVPIESACGRCGASGHPQLPHLPWRRIEVARLQNTWARGIQRGPQQREHTRAAFGILQGLDSNFDNPLRDFMIRVGA